MTDQLTGYIPTLSDAHKKNTNRTKIGNINTFEEYTKFYFSGTFFSGKNFTYSFKQVR